MRVFAVLASIVCFSVLARADEISDLSADCTMKLGDSVHVFAVTTYHGKILPKKEKTSKHESNAVDVTVKGKKPVALLLSSYEPTTWTLHGNTALVEAVFLTGYHTQKLKGLPAKAKKIVTSYDGGGICGSFSGGEPFDWNKLSQKVFNKELVKKADAYGVIAAVVDSSAESIDLSASP